MGSPAPIVVFAYRRPEHLRRTLQSLIQCAGFEASPVIVYGDGPKNEEDRPRIEATRQVARDLLGNRAEYRFSDVNLGLSQSVIRGVTEVTDRFGRVIVLEDDIAVAPEFLAYMNSALDRYAGDSSVFQVSGYMFDVPEFADRSQALFLPLTVSWGWATWKRAWNCFDPAAAGWDALRRDRALRRRFNLENAYDYATMLERQMAGQSDSWAVRWYWSVFQARGLVLFPPVSLTSNIGMDGSGTHGRGRIRRFGGDQVRQVRGDFIEFPPVVGIDGAAFKNVRAAVWRQNGGWLGRAVARIARLGRKLRPSVGKNGVA